MIDNKIIEIKGILLEKDLRIIEAKKQAVLNTGRKYKILYTDDIKYCFNYVSEK